MKSPHRSFASALVALALVIAAPAFAGTFHSVSPRDAGVGFCEGCENASPTVDLAVEGQDNVARVQGLVEVLAGQWEGVGAVNYDGFGVSIHESAAKFVVTFAPSPCEDCLINRFPATIDVFAPDGRWILSAAKLRFVAGVDPQGVYESCAIGDLPSSFRVMRPKRPQGAIDPKTMGWVKGKYLVMPNGRMIRADI